MNDSQYISVRETAQLLGISERKVMDMIDANELQAYKLANQFLRLKRAEVLVLQRSGSIKNETTEFPYTLTERIKDYFYFNDFYLVSGIIIIILVYIVMSL